MYLLILISSIYWGDWTNSGIEELLIRSHKKPTIFLGTRPIEKKELNYFVRNLETVSLDKERGMNSLATDGSYDKSKRTTMWLKERLSLVSRNLELNEWSAEAIGDSLARGAVLIGKGSNSRFVKIFVEGLARVGDLTNEYPSDVWQNICAYDYLKGYIKANIFNFSLVLGREPMKWGPSPRSTLVLSGMAPPFDLVRGAYKSKKFKVSFFTTQLDQFGKMNRYLSGHRIEYKFSKKISQYSPTIYLGFSEVALFGGEGRFPESYYLNPIFLYYPYEWNRGGAKVNILWGFDFNLFFKGFGIYSELMIDDTPYQATPKGDRPKIGANIGIRGTFLNNYWLFEYRGVTRWTYDHIIPYQRYTYIGYPIGHPEGPDFDEFFFGIVHHLNRKIDVISNVSYLRKGEGSVDELYPSSFPTDYWLTGELKHTLKFELGIKWYKLPKFVMTCKGGCIITDKEIFPGISFSISNWR